MTTERLLALGREAGLDAVGVASAEPFTEARATIEDRRRQGLHGGMQFTYRNPGRSTDPQRALPGARSIVVGALSYLRPTDDGAGPPPNQALVARYARDDYYAVLRDALGVVARELQSQGWATKVLADDNALVDRAAAHRAGLGWFGKNTNLLLKGRGSWFVLGSVLTDAPLEPSPGPVADGCGSCQRCLPACPTGALVAPGVLDARRCLAWLVQATGPFPPEYREALGGRIYGCDDCQDVCPPNHVELRRTGPKASEGRESVDLVDLLAADDDELIARFGRWYIPRRDPRYLRRNALVALGNVGDAHDPSVRALIDRYRASDDELLREHADWARARLDARA